MDFFSKSFNQFSDLFKSMTPGARITAGLLLAVIVVSLTYLVRFQNTGVSDLLLGGREFSQSDLANMEAAFGKAGLNDYAVAGNRVRVPRGQKAIYMGALADANALPQDFTRDLDGALESNSFYSAPRHLLEQKVKHAKEKRLSLIISEMSGIDYARVQFESERKPGLRHSQETRAVVAVKPDANNHLDEDRIVAVRNTVVAGIGGLKKENVTVTDLNAGTAYPGTGGGSISGMPDSEYAAHKRYHEKQYQQKIVEMLRDYPGVVVGVSVELDESLEHVQTEHAFDSQKTVPVRTEEVQTDSSTTGSGRGGRPGVIPNTGASNQGAVVSNAQATESTEIKTTSSTQSVPGGSLVKKQLAPLMLKRVNASIGVPSSYYVDLWKKRNPPADGETQAEPDAGQLQTVEEQIKIKIRDMIVTLLPKRGEEGDDPYEHVTVVTIDKLPAEPIAQPSVTETATSWLAGNWQTLGMFFVGVFSLLMLRSMVRSSTPNHPPSDEETPHLQSTSAAVASDPSSAEDLDEESEAPERLRFETSGPNLRNELAQLVKEDPEAAASVLKNWIGDAA